MLLFSVGLPDVSGNHLSKSSTSSSSSALILLGRSCRLWGSSPFISRTSKRDSFRCQLTCLGWGWEESLIQNLLLTVTWRRSFSLWGFGKGTQLFDERKNSNLFAVAAPTLKTIRRSLRAFSSACGQSAAPACSRLRLRAVVLRVRGDTSIHRLSFTNQPIFCSTIKIIVFDAQDVLYAPLPADLWYFSVAIDRRLSKNVLISLMPQPRVGGATVKGLQPYMERRLCVSLHEDGVIRSWRLRDSDSQRQIYKQMRGLYESFYNIYLPTIIDQIIIKHVVSD